MYPSTDALSESGAALQASRNSERAYECQKIGLTTSRTIRISNGDGTFHDEIVYDAHRPTGSLYAPNCVGLSLSVPLMIGHYSLLDGFDYLTRRVGSGLYDTKSYLDTPGI